MNKSDIVRIPVKEDWIFKGAEYALISWTATFNRMGSANPYIRIIRILQGIVAECAFENYLKLNKIPYNTKGRTNWYEEDRYDIGIVDYAVDVKSNVIDITSSFFKKKEITDFEKWITAFTALVPEDQFNPGSGKRRLVNLKKLYVFPYLMTHTSMNHYCTDLLVHAFWDYKWLKKAEYRDDTTRLGHLRISYNGRISGKLVIYGTSEKKQMLVESITCKPGNVNTLNDFYQVFAVRWFGKKCPDGLITICSITGKIKEHIEPEASFSVPSENSTLFTSSNNWQNIMLYKGLLYFAGWIKEIDLRAICTVYPRYCKSIEQYQDTKSDNIGCPVTELEPMARLANLK